MESAASILVVGSTGSLGGSVVRLLGVKGRRVRALVRETADPEKKAALAALEYVEQVSGDLKQPDSLLAACRNIHTVVSTASASVSRQEGDSLESVDEKGQLALLQAAIAQGVKRFVFVSFPEMEFGSPLEDAKRAVERAVIASGIEYVILQPTYFAETWFGSLQAAEKRQLQLFGDGNARTNWISAQDVARFVVAACAPGVQLKEKFELGGPEELSQLEVVNLFRELGAGAIEVAANLPEPALRANFDAASDPLAKTFASIFLNLAHGHRATTDEQQAFLPSKLRSLRDFALDVLGKS